jgi:hypothetical protein
MKIIKLLVDTPAEVATAKIFPLLSARDFVRFDSANLSHRTRRLTRCFRGMTSSVSLRHMTDQKLECTAWEWFWARSAVIIPSRNKVNLEQLSRMVGNEHLVRGTINLTYEGSTHSVLCDQVLGIQAVARKVSQLEVATNDPGDALLRVLSSLTNLKVLCISLSNRPHEKVLSTLLEGCAPLLSLTVDGDLTLTDTLRTALQRHVPTLTALFLTAGFSTATDLYDWVAQCSNLRSLRLREGLPPHIDDDTTMPAASVLAIAIGCPNLQALEICRTNPGIDALTVFASHCPDLRHFCSLETLPGSNITNTALATLASNCPGLTTLWNVGWGVTDEAVVHAAKPWLSRLQQVSLRGLEPFLEGGDGDGDEDGAETGGPESVVSAYHNTLTLAMAHLRDVRALSLSMFHEQGSEQLQVLASRCTKLQTLHLPGEQFFPDQHDFGDAVIAIVARNPLLETISVPGKKWLRDDVMAAVAASCPLLHVLRAQTGPTALTDAGLVALAQGCRKLTAACELSGPELTDLSVLALAEHCPDLTIVNLVHSPQVTEAALTVLVQSCRKLRSLQLCKATVVPDAADRLRAAAAAGQRLAVSLRTPSAFWDFDFAEAMEDVKAAMEKIRTVAPAKP